MKQRIVVVGSSNTDMVVQIPTLPSPGETVLGGDFVVAAGGKGANQAVAAARLGAEVTFVARLGTDVFGDQSLENFKKEGLRTDFVVRDRESSSGVALIMVDDAGENVIAVASGANGRLSEADVEAARDTIAAAPVLLLQLEVPLETVRYAAEIGKEAGARVILDPAPAQELDTELLSNVSILTPNEQEAHMLTGIEAKDSAAAERAAQRLRQRGVESVVITLGEMGAYVLTKDDSELIATARVTPKDTTAAGDAFNGALASALASGQGLREAVCFANRTAAISVTRVGAQPSLPSLQEFEAFGN